MSEYELIIQKFDEALLKGEAAWWQMELPSGNVFFSDSKTNMLGYAEKNFKTYKDFTAIVLPEDNSKAMKAMYDLLEGRSDTYETTYRIKAADGKYLTFFDYGQINKREGENITVIGFVSKVKEGLDTMRQIESFKSFFNGEQSLVELFTKAQHI